MDGMLEAKVAFVTGGASGIGAAIARRFAAEGARVAVADIDAAAGERVAREIADAGGDALFTPCDVAEPESVRGAVAATVARFGGLDVVCANAGINGTFAPVEDLLPEEWDRTLDVNLKGTFLTVHFAVPHLKAAGGGCILVTSSVNGNRSFAYPGASAYGASKAGQVAFVKMTALELGRDGIRVNAVCPGAVPTGIDRSTRRRNTDRIRIRVDLPEGSPALHGGVGTPEDVADACLMLASDLGRHVSGVELYVDGGASLVL